MFFPDSKESHTETPHFIFLNLKTLLIFQGKLVKNNWTSQEESAFLMMWRITLISEAVIRLGQLSPRFQHNSLHHTKLHSMIVHYFNCNSFGIMFTSSKYGKRRLVMRNKPGDWSQSEMRRNILMNNNWSYTMMTRPIKTLELRYPMIQFLITPDMPLKGYFHCSKSKDQHWWIKLCM